MRHSLSKFISPQQFGFLKNLQIHDVVAIAQGCLHSIHTQKLNAAIVKVDLKKAFYCLDWGYLRLVLHKVSVQSRAAEWTMACL